LSLDPIGYSSRLLNRLPTARYPPTLMTKTSCKTCIHFRTAPYQAPLTGCWHGDNMTVTQKPAYLDQQQSPGDHRVINLRGDCQQHEAKPKRPSLLDRLRAMGAA